MSYRRFNDTEGRAWEAWEVHPSAVERRLNSDRRQTTRANGERRQQHEFRLVLPWELRGGWLALQGTKGTKGTIRLAPIPDGWMTLSDDDLAMLVAARYLAS